jgi:photosystem II stability/assembly factor-like uncharacterized protein
VWLDGDAAAAVGFAGAVSASADGGLTWTAVAVPCAQNLRSVVGFGDERIAVGDGGCVAHSSDAGASWQTATHFVPSSSGSYFNEVVTTGSGRAFAVGSSGAVLVLGPP